MHVCWEGDLVFATRVTKLIGSAYCFRNKFTTLCVSLENERCLSLRGRIDGIDFCETKFKLKRFDFFGCPSRCFVQQAAVEMILLSFLTTVHKFPSTFFNVKLGNSQQNEFWYQSCNHTVQRIQLRVRCKVHIIIINHKIEMCH